MSKSKPKQTPRAVVREFESGHGTTRSYTIGFGLSLYLTITAYLLVSHHLFSRSALLVAIFTMALLQLLVQLIFFLHLSRESKPRWNLTLLLFAVGVVIILVGGSIWIMNNLDYHMKTPAQTDKAIMRDEAIH